MYTYIYKSLWARSEAEWGCCHRVSGNSLSGALFQMSYDDRLDGMPFDAADVMSGSASSESEYIEGESVGAPMPVPPIASDEQRHQFMQHWFVACLALVYEDYLEGHRPALNNRQKSHRLRSWRDRMSAASLHSCVEASLLDLPTYMHERLYGVEAACKLFLESETPVNDDVAVRRTGDLADPPLLVVRKKLTDLLWRRLHAVTALDSPTCQRMAHASRDLLRDSGYRMVQALLLPLFGPGLQQEYWHWFGTWRASNQG